MDLTITSYCHIRENKVVVNDRLVFYQENILTFADFIKSVYKQEQISYPKFYKMDSISKLGFLAAELALKERPVEGYPPETVGVVMSNSSSSLDTDMAHHETIKNRSSYFPSPAVFVYTLPNIVVGEICIRNRIKGENAFLIAEAFDSSQLSEYVNELFEHKRVAACLCGWVEVLGDRSNALVTVVEKNDHCIEKVNGNFRMTPFNSGNLEIIMNRN